MRALVISGGGSKGAYAGGVAEHLIRVQKKQYDLYVGTSTGSLLLSHLSIGKIDKLYKLYTSVGPKDIFSLNPFRIKRKENREYVTINYFNILRQFLKGKRTFGESENLKKLFFKSLTPEEYKEVKQKVSDLLVTVSNLSKNTVEYKSIKDFDYEEFVDWVWISCNYVPFMSLVERNGFEYADGGFGATVPIGEAIARGATEIDAIILEAENREKVRVLGKNPFSLMMDLFGFMFNQVETANIVEGQLMAAEKDVKLNLYYTPSKLTENALVFDQKLMANWWQQGFDYAAKKAQNLEEDESENWWLKLFKGLRG